ncbi:MAG: DUF4132 domain-containing protein [Tannerella sp.]|jgi:hypothetical protein|nr:DUF4132 domain-containing protein [Tannerella sp.]
MKTQEEEIIGKMKKLTGRAGVIAKALIAYRESNYAQSYNRREALKAELNEGMPRTPAEVYGNGPEQLFEAVHGKKIAGLVGKVAARMTDYVHSPSIYRRSFRTQSATPYMERMIHLVDTVFFPWETFDMVKDLTSPRRDEDKALAGNIYGDFLSVYIDDGNQPVIDAIKEICLGDNNTRLLDSRIINGIVKSSNRELYELLGNMLLAAKLQEGLRQSILEDGDNGRVEFFIYILKLVLDNGLLRFSSAVRAVDVWMGLDERAEDRRVVTKLATLGYTYLTDRKACREAVNSKDLLEIYTALWATSVYEMNDVMPLVDQLMKGEKYRKPVALYVVHQLENKTLQFKIASGHLEETDLDILSLVILNYPVDYGWAGEKNDFAEKCRKIHGISDKKLRDDHFDKLLNILPLIPQKGYQSVGKPFDWCALSLSEKDIFTRLLTLAGYDFDPVKTGKLIDHMALSDSGNREKFVRFFLDEPANAGERAFLFAALGDKSMPVRTQALKNIKKLEITDGESQQIMNLLALKTGDLRQNAVEILLSMPAGRPFEAVKILLADRQENKRLAGLDMANRLLKNGTLHQGELPALLDLMPKVTDEEQLLVDAMTSQAPEYGKENGFGLYDAAWRPDFGPLKSDKKHTLRSIFDFDTKRLIKIVDDICNRIHENREYTYQIRNWDDSLEDVMLGGQQWIRFRADVSREGSTYETRLDDYVLQDVWRGWIRDNRVTYGEMTLFMFLDDMKNHRDSYEPDYQKWAVKMIGAHFNVKEGNQLIRYIVKREYGRLALNIMDMLWVEYSEKERFETLAGALTDLMHHVPGADWIRPVREETHSYYRREPDTFADTGEVCFFTTHLARAVKEDEHFTRYVSLCYELGRLSGIVYKGLRETDVARAVELGILKKDALYRTFFLSDTRYLATYAGKITYKKAMETVQQYPMLKTVAEEVAARVIEIELKRGDSKTEVSELAGAIRWHEGAGNFAKTLIAMGKETFVRGYVYDSNTTKKAVLSSLLKASHPMPSDDAGTLRVALDGKVKDKRLLEAAMYAPSWLNIAGKYLGWPGLQSAAWYFHAHINQSFSAEKETEVARYSPISPQEFNDGAFDIEWFKEAYRTLGDERFNILYDCAKYLTEGGNHRRAQLFADATLGKLDITELKKEIRDKRNKDKLLSYPLVPLGKNRQKDMLERYGFIRKFQEESKTFGAQRRESEGKASAIALENLARNAGFSDALRFGWRMETLKIQELTGYFEPKEREGTVVFIEIDKDGIAKLVCEKDRKRLSSLPVKLKKDAYITECREVVSSLKAQHKRAKASLEQSMVKRDLFEFGELTQLMAHPVIAPFLQKLLFVSGERIGAYCELADLPENTQVSIAHPYDLYRSGRWIDFQRYAFENRLVQPFKQIFRELYLVNADELNEKTKSRRYAGHQVQPRKTVALLKSRGWTVDYGEGLQRVYYKDNIIATMYAAADWFSPADTESPTLETVQFFNRKTREPLPLDLIPPVIFSEVMRDIDLVVSVAHVGGVDPEASHSTVEMRAVIVKELLALLQVGNVTVNGRFASIRGSLGEYTVHLGSGTVQKTGRGAVNILAVQSQHRGRIFLPFADEDPRTAEIMSKIILLAEDEKIKDPAILEQLK